MRTHARAVVIGGGVVGVSTLYHLARKGWSDSVLVERKELTSGSTWHAAGLLPLFNLSYSVGQIHKYSVALYQTLEKEIGLDVGLRQVSNIRLARTRDRMDEYHYYAGVAATIGVKVKFLTPQEVKEIWPLCNVDGIIGAIQHPEDGYIQPADLTQALARAARERGAEINRHTTVIAIERRPGGEWKVVNRQGRHRLRAHRLGDRQFRAPDRKHGRDQRAGHSGPAPIYRHRGASRDLRRARPRACRRWGSYANPIRPGTCARRRAGSCSGLMRKARPPVMSTGRRRTANTNSFQEDLDRLAPHIETAIARVPAFGEVGIKKVYNGAIAYTPDGSPIVGPAPGLKNFWLNEGHSFGVTAAGGAGWQLAEWIVDGESTIDMLGVDPRRFGSYADEGYLVEKNEEAYAKVFTVHYPDEERVAARPLRQTPCYSRMKALGAVFGSIYGWERPNWFAPPGYALSETDLAKPDVLLNENHPAAAEGERPREKWSFRRSNYFQFVGAECRNVHENVGLQDMSAFAKLEVSGPGAESWLNSILTNRIPMAIGRVTLTYLLTVRGGVRAEFTLTRIGPERFYLVSAGALESHDFDSLERLLPGDGSVRIDKVTTQCGVLVLAGPRSREVLAKVADIDVSNEAFPWLTARRLSIRAAGVIAMRVNFVGELGYELHHPIEMQNVIFDALIAAGTPFGIKPFGIRAMDSLRLEKSYKLVGRELSIEYAALESGLDRFVDFKKGLFLGRDALITWVGKGFENRLVTLEVQGVSDADARGSEPVTKDGAMVGRTTSGGYGWRTGKSLALAMVKPEFSHTGDEVDLRILGETRRAVVIGDSPYDRQNAALRA